MAYTVHMRNDATGEIRILSEADDWDELADYMWFDGSRCCDCNRSLCFYGDEPFDDVYNCDTNNFTIMRIELPDGTKLDGDDAGEHWRDRSKPDASDDDRTDEK